MSAKALRHRWEKLAVHHYRCKRCGMQKHNRIDQDGQWQASYQRGADNRSGATPPCPGEWIQQQTEASDPSGRPYRVLGQWNAYVEQGNSRAERRRRLAEVPDSMRDAVAAHVQLSYQLRAAARHRQNHNGYRR